MTVNLIGEIALSALTIAQNSTKFTDPVPFYFCNGYAAGKLTSSAGSVTVTQQCASTKLGPWFDPVDYTNASLGSVASLMSAGTRYVQFNPVMSQFARFKVVEANVASTTFNMSVYYQEGA